MTQELSWKRRYGKDTEELILRHSKYLHNHTVGEDTVKAYEKGISLWLEFLKERKVTIPHKDGLMFPESGSRLPQGQMSDLLGAYCQHILEKGYPMSAVKTRLSAVIWLHKINGVRHECLKPMWDKAGNYISTHKPKEKQWLTDKQLSDLDNRAWEKIERDPLEAAFRVVYECVREAIYRPISVTLKTLTDTDIRLRMEDVKFGQADDKVQCLDMSIREKIKGNPMANVRLKKWPYNPTPNCKRGGLLEPQKQDRPHSLSRRNACNIYAFQNEIEVVGIRRGYTVQGHTSSVEEVHNKELRTLCAGDPVAVLGSPSE